MRDTLDDNEFSRLIDEYSVPSWDYNPEMSGVEIVWERNNPNFGALHIWMEHGVTENEVEEVLIEQPPHADAKQHPDYPNRTMFWGATRYDRWLIVVCEDWIDIGVRYLRPITAFEPSDGADYWERF